MWIVVSSESARDWSVRHNLLLQMLMNVSNSLLVIRMPHAPTHLGPTHVPATKDLLEMEQLALVCRYLIDYPNLLYVINYTVFVVILCEILQ